MAIQAVLFDVDGTILDTVDFIFGAFDHALDFYRLPPRSHREMRHFIGPPLEEVYSNLVPGCDAQAMTEAHRQFQETHLELTKVFPDTVPVLEELKNRNIKLAAITTRSIRTSVRSLEVHDLMKYFDCIISAEDVSNHKPHPEPVLKALETIHIDSANAIMVGDTSADILAGRNAGTKTVAALYGFGGESLLQLKPDYAIECLAGLRDILDKNRITG